MGSRSRNPTDTIDPDGLVNWGATDLLFTFLPPDGILPGMKVIKNFFAGFCTIPAISSKKPIVIIKIEGSEPNLVKKIQIQRVKYATSVSLRHLLLTCCYISIASANTCRRVGEPVGRLAISH